MHDMANIVELFIWAVYFLGVATGLIVLFVIKKIIQYFEGD